MRPLCLQCSQVLFLFLTYIVCQRHLLDAVLCVWSLVFLFSAPFLKFFSDLLHEWTRVSYEGDSPGIYPFDKVPVIFCLEQFSGSSEILFFNFSFHFHLFDGVSFQYSPLYVGLLFSECFDYHLIW